MPERRSNSGSVSLVMALAFLTLTLSITGGLWFKTRKQNEENIRALKRYEGFYNSEIAAWHGEAVHSSPLQSNLPEEGQGARGRFELPLDVNYPPKQGPHNSRKGYEHGHRSKFNRAYNPDQYEEGQPLDFEETREFDSGTSFIQRTYSNEANGNLRNILFWPKQTLNGENYYCGNMFFKGEDESYRACLAKVDPNTSPQPSPSPSVSPSPTPSPSPSPSATPSPTPTPSPSPSATPTPTPTPSPSPSPSPTSTPHPSPSLSPFPSPTASPTPTVSPTPVPSPSPGGDMCLMSPPAGLCTNHLSGGCGLLPTYTPGVGMGTYCTPAPNVFTPCGHCPGEPANVCRFSNALVICGAGNNCNWSGGCPNDPYMPGVQVSYSGMGPGPCIRDAQQTGNVAVIVMIGMGCNPNTDSSLRAVIGNGTGRVTSSDGLVNIETPNNSAATVPYIAGTSVTLTATPGPCDTFDHFDLVNGAGTTTANPVTLTVLSNHQSRAVAYFNPDARGPYPACCFSKTNQASCVAKGCFWSQTQQSAPDSYCWDIPVP